VLFFSSLNLLCYVDNINFWLLVSVVVIDGVTVGRPNSCGVRNCHTAQLSNYYDTEDDTVCRVGLLLYGYSDGNERVGVGYK